ncbi:hypothetical protein BKG82_23125 [Mycobacteroides chelonae]|uniref:Uncharacterized protein n=1 Tax=Mycobacteroides chelonae TaxID=1774 RepID=A0A1S1LKS2_MYCCH|nr:hypothetical protein [Mycobacteroides chelonae]OHU51492.1 hypothetical protein BKG82_23125 [Mycobacteroides chelonae]
MFKPGDDVIVDFEGLEHNGHVERADSGWILCTIETDWAYDYGSITARMGPHQTVCVPQARVRLRD